MAGMLPGVELARRRRTNHHHQFDSKSRDPPVLHLPRLHPSTAMDDTALRARKRLEEKLRGSNASPTAAPTAADGAYRRRVSPNNQSRSLKQEQVADMGFLKLQRWSIRFQPQKSQKEVCSICLEEFQTEQPVMNLPCFHKYHSKCLLPWLTAQSHCPYCRTGFHSP